MPVRVVRVVRWLIALIAAAVLWGSAVTSWAAAGFAGESECCCPVKAECRCHDHDGQPQPDTTLKRCGGTAELVAPVAIAAIEPAPVPLLSISRVITTIAHPLLLRTGALLAPPETPPF